MTSIDQNLASNNQDNSDLANNSDFSLKLKHYEIRASLGEGGFGQVYEAWDSKLCRKVAIKRMKNLGNGVDAASLVKEARLAASLQHAAFVKIHAIEDDEDSQSIVMELVPGLTLKEVIQQIAKDAFERESDNDVGNDLNREQKALEIILQISEAMQEAHDTKLIHGDLKPSNFIIEPSGKVRILDFGLAIKGDPNATTSVSQQDPEGTIAYMSPELFSGTTANAQSDIYALGTILYELVHGARPFAKLHGLALAAAQVHNTSDQWTYSEKVSTNTVQLIRAMTAHDVKSRCASMQVVSQKIKAILQNGAAISTNTPFVMPTSLSSVMEENGLKKAPSKTQSRIKNAFIFGALLLTTAVGWQALPYLTTVATSLKPYSEALEMAEGLDALKAPDLPNNLEAAEKHFNKIIERNPSNAAAVAGLSLVYGTQYISDKQDESWLKKADASAQQAMHLNNQLALSYVAQSLVLENQGKKELALQAVDRAMNLDPSNFFAWKGKVKILRKMRLLDEAFALIEKAQVKFPKERYFAEALGLFYYEKGDYKKAEDAFRLSIKLQPDAVFSYANLNGALLMQNRNDEALAVLQTGLQIRPSAQLYIGLGNALFLKGDYLGATLAFENAVSPSKGNPQQWEAWVSYGDALLWVPGKKEEANVAYDKATDLINKRLKKLPNDAFLKSNIALIQARLNQTEKAISSIDEVLSTKTSNPNVYFQMGMALEIIGQRDRAIETLKIAMTKGIPSSYIEATPEFNELKRDPRYTDLIKEI